MSLIITNSCFFVLVSVLHITQSNKPILKEVDEFMHMDIHEINKGLDLHEGDIIQSNQPSGTKRRRVARSPVAASQSALWDVPVPYVFEESLGLRDKGVILQAFDRFRLKSCVDFKPRDKEEYYLSIRKNRGCYSYVTKVVRGGQTVSIGEGCAQLAIVEHEILHALGFHHEHSRYDRDDYITIIWDSIAHKYWGNFKKFPKNTSLTYEAPYDYISVMHYNKFTFSRHSSLSIYTKQQDYQDKIGQRMDMSPLDILKLNLLYNCSTSVSLLEHCDFSSDAICGMMRCGKSGAGGWLRLTAVAGGPLTDHTSLGKSGGHFMHVSTISGGEGQSARLETKVMTPTRSCHVQCLQFYYFHSGHHTDQLNVWIREYERGTNTTQTPRLMGQIKGSPKWTWKFHQVPLDASQPFQVVFEVRKGDGTSSGGISIDDVNLSQSECPHHVWEVENFERILTTNDFDTHLFSPVIYSLLGYAFRLVIQLQETRFGIFVQVVSGANDSKLEWPSPRLLLTPSMLDQNSDVRQQMSKQVNILTDPEDTDFDNPSEFGTLSIINGKRIFVNPGRGMSSFLSLSQMKDRHFLKGGTAIFTLSVHAVEGLRSESTFPCPTLPPSGLDKQPSSTDPGPCGTGYNSAVGSGFVNV